MGYNHTTKQKRTNENCRRENRSRKEHVYVPGDAVVLSTPGKLLRKLEAPRKGPYEVVGEHDDGSVTIQKSPYVTDRVNKRRLSPFYER